MESSADRAASEHTNHQLTKAEVFDVLVGEILTLKLRPGEALPERQLAERFGLSRTPIREILRRLQSQRLVHIRANHGAFVQQLTPDNARELFQLREVLEPLAAGLAAEFRPDEAVAALWAKFAEDEATQALGPEQLVDLGRELHDSIALWSRNQLYVDIYRALKQQTQWVRAMTRTSLEIEAVSFREHREIARAVLEGQPDLARYAMAYHLARSQRAVLTRLQPHDRGE